jgi:hypothetical protein
VLGVGRSRGREMGEIDLEVKWLRWLGEIVRGRPVRSFEDSQGVRCD